jgi:hypothetical protein
MKTILAQGTEKSTAAHGPTATSLTPTEESGDAWLQPVPSVNVVGKAASEEENKDPRKTLQEFVEKFQHKANPTPTVAPKLRVKHFTVEISVTPKRPPASPPGLGTQEFPVISPKVPLRQEEK